MRKVYYFVNLRQLHARAHKSLIKYTSFVIFKRLLKADVIPLKVNGHSCSKKSTNTKNLTLK